MTPVELQAHAISSLVQAHTYSAPDWGAWASAVVFLLVAVYLIAALPRMSLRTGAIATIVIAALLLTAGLAVAQTPAPAGAAPQADVAPVKKSTPKKSAIKPKEERSADSIACSAEADQKGLKGKERVSFRRKCLAAAKKSGGSKKG